MIWFLNHKSIRFQKDHCLVKENLQFVIKLCVSSFSRIFQRYYNLVRICQFEIIFVEKIFVIDSIIRLNRSDITRSSTISTHWKSFLSIFSSLTSVSFTSLFNDIFIEDFIDSTTSVESSNMSKFSEFSNQERAQFTSFDTTLELIFSIAQRFEIANIIVAAIKTIQMQQFISSSITVRSQKSMITEFIKKWTVDEIEFFDSNVDDVDSIINAKRHVFYKNIYAFVNRLKNMINIREENKLRTILSQCFRNAALIWHFIELSDVKKDLLRQINLIFWYQVMINRFKKFTSLILFVLQNFKYTLSDARTEKEFRFFAQQIFRSIKTVNMNSIHNQLTIVWNNLDWQFRANISKSTVITFIRKFLNQINFMSDI